MGLRRSGAGGEIEGKNREPEIRLRGKFWSIGSHLVYSPGAPLATFS